MSTFSGLTAASSALFASQRAMDVTGQNIANANTEGYTRQRVVMQSQVGSITPALYATTDRVGTGVAVSDVQRLRDEYLENRGRTEHAAGSYLTNQTSAYSAIEDVFAEPSTTALQAQFGAMADTNRDLLTAGQRAARETMLAFAGTVETYGRQGQTVTGGVRRPSLVDEAI